MKYDDLSIEEIKQEHERWQKRYRRWRIFINIFSILATIGLVVIFVMLFVNDNGGI